jgi:hypothetical protein
MDMTTRPNCCDTQNIYVFLRQPDGRFGARQSVPYTREGQPFAVKSFDRPHLIDWNRDGRTDLVLDAGWRVLIGQGPLNAQSTISTNIFVLPDRPEANGDDLQFTDWDGDGTFDLLFAALHLNADKKHWLADIYWCRNTAKQGEPKFDPPVKLLTAPAQADGWNYHGFAVRNRGQAGQQEIIISTSKDWKRKPERGYIAHTRLTLFPRAIPEGHRRARP